MLRSAVLLLLALLVLGDLAAADDGPPQPALAPAIPLQMTYPSAKEVAAHLYALQKAEKRVEEMEVQQARHRETVHEQARQQRASAAAARQKKVAFPLGLGRRRVAVTTGLGSSGWWDDVQAGRWEPETFKALYQEVTSDVTYLGVGEWVGVTGLFAAQRSKRTILVEPDPLAVGEMRANLEIESRDTGNPRITISTKCVSDKRGPVTMTGNGSSTSSLLPGLPWLQGAPTFEATCVTLADLFQEYYLSGKVFIKMDIEGAEASVIPSLFTWLSTLETGTKPSFFISFHRQATPNSRELKEQIARVLNLYPHFAILKGHPHVEMDTSDCKLGVPLTDNKHGTAFSAENICDTCDVLLSTSRARSDILCARNTVRNANAAQTSLLSKTTQSVGGGGKEETGTRDFTPKQAQEWQTSSTNDAQNSRTHEHARTRDHGTHARDQGSSQSLSLSSIAGEIHVLEHTVSDLNSTVDNLLKKVSTLELQHDWSQVATTYVTCSLGMTWSEIIKVVSDQKISGTSRPEIVTGGLGRKMVFEKFEVWICSRSDRCAISEDDFMCYVYDEQERIFLPWSTNGELRLVKGGPFLSGHESTAALALAQVRLLREEVNQLKQMNTTAGSGICTGSLTVVGPCVRKFTSEQNISSNLWRETAAVFFIPGAPPQWQDLSAWNSMSNPIQYEDDRTISFSHVLAVDKGGSTCFARMFPGNYASQHVLRFTTIESQYAGRAGDNELVLSAQSPDFCQGNLIKVTNVQHIADRFQIGSYSQDHSPFVVEALPWALDQDWQANLGAGYQPIAVQLSNGGTLFYNFHAGQNFNYDLTQRHVLLWGGTTGLADPITSYDIQRGYHATFSRGNFQKISAVPLLRGYIEAGYRSICSSNNGWMTCGPSDEPRFAFSRVNVGIAQAGSFVYFAGGLEVTGDGPQGEAIRRNRGAYTVSGSGSGGGVARIDLPSLRPMQDVTILNVDTGVWTLQSLSFPRFGVAGAGVGSKIFFAGGARLGNADGTAVVPEFTWQVNTSSCSTQCMEFWQWQESGTSSESRCYFNGCQALPWQMTVINSDVVEVNDTRSNSPQQMTLKQPRRFAAGAAIPALDLVLFAGGVTTSDATMPAGGWKSSQTSDAVDIFTVDSSTGAVSNANAAMFPSPGSIAAGKLVAGSAGNMIVLLRHDENVNFDSTGYIFDGSTWTTTNHPGQCGVQDSTTSTPGGLLVFLSACEPEAYIFILSSRTWQRHRFTHSAHPSRIVASLDKKLLFAGRMLADDQESSENCGYTYWSQPGQPGNPYSPPTVVCPQPAPPPGSNGLCGWDGLSTWRSASCGGSAGLYHVPQGFVTASVKISSLANPALSVSRTIVFPARLPEVDAMLSFQDLYNTSHLGTDTWSFACQATVNGRSTLSLELSGQEKICLVPHDVYNDDFVAHGGRACCDEWQF